jgi:hypothetical protein
VKNPDITQIQFCPDSPPVKVAWIETRRNSMTTTFPIFTLDYTRLTKQMAAVLMVLIMACMVACSTAQVVTDLELATTIIDDAGTIAAGLGFIPAPIATILTDAALCIQSGLVPALQAGGKIGTVIGTALHACYVAVQTTIPTGTDATLAAKVDAEVVQITKLLGEYGITIPPATPAPTASAMVARAQAMTVIMPKLRAVDREKLAALAAHVFKPLPPVR